MASLHKLWVARLWKFWFLKYSPKTGTNGLFLPGLVLILRMKQQRVVSNHWQVMPRSGDIWIIHILSVNASRFTFSQPLNLVILIHIHILALPGLVEYYHRPVLVINLTWSWFFNSETHHQKWKWPDFGFGKKIWWTKTWFYYSLRRPEC